MTGKLLASIGCILSGVFALGWQAWAPSQKVSGLYLLQVHSATMLYVH